MREINQPFQTIEEIDNYLSGNKIECLLCGKKYVGLALHIHLSHEIGLRNYRIKFNIPLSRGLIGAEYRAFRVKNMTNNRFNPGWEEKRVQACENSNKLGGTGNKDSEIPAISAEMRHRNARKKIAENAAEKILVNCALCKKELVRSKHSLKLIKGRKQKPTCGPCADKSSKSQRSKWVD